jgi:3-isopropylmalate/(R)-2-methylmalate dehydratase small subunit
MTVSAVQPFTTLTAVAAPLALPNVDTDMIFPAQHGKTIARRGLGRCLFSRERYHPDGSENPEFVLNKPAYRGAQILLAGENFGCGSSREHAPWALLDFGIRCLIAPSFADIFFANCFKNGMLPVRLARADVDHLMALATERPGVRLTVDLIQQQVAAPGGWTRSFAVDPDRREALLQGVDEIGATLDRVAVIEAFEKRRWADRPWLEPRGSGGPREQ